MKKLFFGAAAATEAKDLDQGLRQIKAVRHLPRQPFEIDELSFDVLHQLAAGADNMVMRFGIAVHKQRGRMRTHLSQHSTFNEKPEIVVNSSQRNRWNAAPDRGVNVFRRIVPMRCDDSLIDHLTLVRDRQAMLRSQLAELFMGEAHDYRVRTIIKRLSALSTESLVGIFRMNFKRCGQPCHDGGA
jgi:hypothetical protein